MVSVVEYSTETIFISSKKVWRSLAAAIRKEHHYGTL